MPKKKKSAKRGKAGKRGKAIATRTTRNPTETTSDEVQAQVWTLREEGKSYRDISAELKINTRTVGRILAKDPARIADLVRAQKEERGKLWQQIENLGLKNLRAWLEQVGETLTGPKGGRKSRFTDRDLELIKAAGTVLTPLRMISESGTRMSQLLTGGPTERFEESPVKGGFGALNDMTDEELIIAAVENGLTHLLPARLREEREKIGKDS